MRVNAGTEGERESFEAEARKNSARGYEIGRKISPPFDFVNTFLAND